MGTQAATMDRLAVGKAFADAYARGDDERLRELLHPEVHERELVPGGLVDTATAEATIAEARDFRARWERIDVLLNEVVEVGDLLRWANRWRLEGGGRIAVIEFHAFLTVAAGRVTAIDAVCSGARDAPR